MLNRKKISLIICILLNVNMYANTTLDSNATYGQHSVFQTNEQNKILLKQTKFSKEYLAVLNSIKNELHQISQKENMPYCQDLIFQMREQNKILLEQTKTSKKYSAVLASIENELQQISQRGNSTKKFWGALAGTIIPSFVAIAIFEGGVLHEKNKEKNKKKSLLHTISLLLDIISSKCDSTIKTISTYHENIEKTPWAHNAFPMVLQGEAKRLREINIDHITDAFFAFNISPEKYVELYSRLDYFYELSTSMHDDYFKHSHDAVTIPTNEI